MISASAGEMYAWQPAERRGIRFVKTNVVLCVLLNLLHCCFVGTE